jgi:thioredoxin reductase (NADPH)
VVDADADDDVEALLIPPDRLHALIVAEAELSERIVRALILRRAAHIESGSSGPVLIGDLQSPDMLRLENFLRRNGQPHHAVDPSQDKAAALLLTQYGASDAQDVLVACPNGSMLLTPSEDSLARCLGMLDSLERDELFDVAIVGAGPAGLSTAVYAASGHLSPSAARSGARPARARESRIIWAFQLASRVRPSPVVRSCRRKSSARNC